MGVKPIFDESGTTVGIEISVDDASGAKPTKTKYDANEDALRTLGRQLARFARDKQAMPSTNAGRDALLKGLCEAVSRLIYATQFDDTE